MAKCNVCGGSGRGVPTREEPDGREDGCMPCKGTGEVPEWNEQSWDKHSAKISVQLDTYKGFIRVDLFELLDDLDDKAKKQLMRDDGWRSLVTEEMIADIKAGFSTPNYSPFAYEIRQALLTSEAMPNILSSFLRALLNELKREAANRSRFENAYYRIYHDKEVRDNDYLRGMVNGALENYKGPDNLPDSGTKEWVDHLFHITGLLTVIEETRQAEANDHKKKELDATEETKKSEGDPNV